MPHAISCTEAECKAVEDLLDKFGVWGMMVLLSGVTTEKEKHSQKVWGPKLSLRWRHLSRKFLKLADELDDPYNS